MFGFLKTIGKIGAGVAGFIAGGPAGAMTGYKAADLVLGGSGGGNRVTAPLPPLVESYAPPPPQIIPPAPLPPVTQLPYLSYSGGGAGAGPVNTFNQASTTGSKASGLATSASKASHKRATPKRKTTARRTMKKKSPARKPKFGSAAYRKKYLGHKK